MMNIFGNRISMQPVGGGLHRNRFPFNAVLSLCSIGGALFFAECDAQAASNGSVVGSNHQQSRAIVSQAQGEAVISNLVAAIKVKYPANGTSSLLRLLYIEASPGNYSLLKDTDIIVPKEYSSLIIEFQEGALSKGVHFADSRAPFDPLISLANFPAHPKYRKKIAELLSSQNPAVRVGALLTLARMPHPTLIPLIAERLKDSNLDVRLAAVIAFGAEDIHVRNTFLLERPGNSAEMARQEAVNASWEPPHPYQNKEVEAILRRFLAAPVRIGDISAILNTAVTLKMKNLVSLTEQVHAVDRPIEAFLQQCYGKLRALP